MSPGDTRTVAEPTWDDVVAPYAERLPDPASCGCPVWQHLTLESLFLATHGEGCADGRTDADLGDRSGITPITRMGLAAMLRGHFDEGRAAAQIAAERKAEAAIAEAAPASIPAPADVVTRQAAQLTAEVEAFAAGAAEAEAVAAGRAAADAAVSAGPAFDPREWDRFIGGQEISAVREGLSLQYPHRLRELVCGCAVWAVDGAPVVQLHSTGCRFSGHAHAVSEAGAALLGAAAGTLLTPQALAAAVRGIKEDAVEAVMAGEAETGPVDWDWDQLVPSAAILDAVDALRAAIEAGNPELLTELLPEVRRIVSEAEAIARRRDLLTEIPHSIRGYMTHDALWTMTPALARIKADAERNGVSPWAQLGAALARVSASIPTWVRLVPETGSPNGAGGANVDIYVVLSGPGGSGKSVVIKAGRAYCDADAHGFGVGATPTGEGLNKHLLEMEEGVLDEDGKFTPSRRAWNPAFLIEEGEGENFTKMALQRDSTILGQLRAHWGGDQAGKPTADASRRTTIDAMWARVATLLILHPEVCTDLLMQVGNGSSARFVWLPAYRTGPATVTDEAETPFQLPRYGARHFVEGDGVAPSLGSLMPSAEKPEIVWIRQPAAMRRAIDLEGVRAYVDPTAITEASDMEARKMHDMLQRFKLATVLAAMDGIVQPEDVHWHAATEIVEVSHRVQKELMGAVQRVTEIKSEDKGRELALTDVTRTAERDSLVASDVEAAQSAIIAELIREPLTRAELRKRVRATSRPCARGYTAAFNLLAEARVVIDAGRGQPLGLDLAARNNVAARNN